MLSPVTITLVFYAIGDKQANGPPDGNPTMRRLWEPERPNEW